jgi:paraquat-inducible protein B
VVCPLLANMQCSRLVLTQTQSLEYGNDDERRGTLASLNATSLTPSLTVSSLQAMAAASSRVTDDSRSKDMASSKVTDDRSKDTARSPAVTAATMTVVATAAVSVVRVRLVPIANEHQLHPNADLRTRLRWKQYVCSMRSCLGTSFPNLTACPSDPRRRLPCGRRCSAR